MISDILSQVVVDLDHYLTDPNFDRTYDGELREQIIRFRDKAECIRAVLDALPETPSTGETVRHEGHELGGIEPTKINDPERPQNVQDTPSGRKSFIDWMMSEETAHDMTTPYYSQKDLLQRGWSKDLIKQILGAQDWKDLNPHITNGAPMLCWRQDRVHAAEDASEFKEHLAQKSKSAGGQQ